ncbi:hypothetical protein CE143_24260 [Photorhabdus luminescens]|uniref:Uncharacterized protein n=1 Tax=Photorhabdus akhurstii TaxID=171438 RepID=A0ABX8M084_9GAMM|nr:MULTISPECIES: hypothetical protein [Photorhabdus]KGM26127.1 hypothetical protein KS18_22570 [Photorhabdus luminescens]QXF35951.1 hypothetical protein B0X70_24220 [Photorhabdus akhurstii]UJD77787.1 hypothetical protein CE143_24260 [Photorhabdus luminescens]
MAEDAALNKIADERLKDAEFVSKKRCKPLSSVNGNIKDRISLKLIDDLKSYSSIIKWLFSQFDLKKETYVNADLVFYRII